MGGWFARTNLERCGGGPGPIANTRCGGRQVGAYDIPGRHCRYAPSPIPAVA